MSGRARTSLVCAARLLAAAVVVVLGGCSPGPERLNVYLITLDTTRADHLGCYGHAGIATPNIDGLASRGVRYDNAFTPAPITLPAHTSILTGRYPIRHGVRENGGFYVPAEIDTLAEILSREGYRTAAFVGAFPLDSQSGLDQGFEVYDDHYPSSLEQGRHPRLRRFYDERPAAEVSAAARAWLRERGDGPFFLWTHYFDPHQPQQPPSPYRERYAGNLYDGEIASVDEAIGSVLAELRQQELLDHTLVVLTADHGEGLGEHGEATHALLLYSSTVRVPLIVVDPHEVASQGSVVSATVANLDVFATVLDRLAVPVPAGTQGPPLPRSQATAPAAREVLSETLFGRLIYGWSPLYRLTVGGRDQRQVLLLGPTAHLYEEVNESSELTDLTPAEVQELTRRLEQHRATLAAGGEARPRTRVSQETADRLAALGYLGRGGGGEVNDEVDNSRSDPLQMMEVFDLSNEGQALADGGDFEMAVAVLGRAAEIDPDNPFVLQGLAQAYWGQGELDSARTTLDHLLAVDPEHLPGHLILASLSRSAGDLERAAELMKQAVALDPDDLGTRLLSAYLEEDRGAIKAAEAVYRAILERDPEHTLACNGLATLLYSDGQATEAVALLESLLKRQPFFPPAWLNLAVIEYDRGDRERALTLVERALELRPGYGKALELKAMLVAGNDGKGESQ